MPVGIVGRKCGMTRVFTETGVAIPVTVIEATPNRVTDIKTVDRDGYRALQITAGSQKESRITKPEAGHFAKSNQAAGNVVREFRLLPEELPEAKVGDQLTVDIFKLGQAVDVRGLTRGKGFAGTVKRHNFNTQDATHGNSLSHRRPGSIGQNQSPGRVFKGKRMAGHMGNVYRTAQNQEVVRVDLERNLLLVKGAIPGAPGTEVVVTASQRTRGEE